MSLRILADENVDQRIVHRLAHYGHDVEHVDFVPALGKGTADESIAAHSLETERVILTSDEDFLVEFDVTEFRAILFIEDETLSVAQITEIVDEIAGAVTEPDDVFYVSRNWL